jgi:hypothetical protein
MFITIVGLLPLISARSYLLLEMGIVMHSCEGEIVCQSSNPKIPYFNAPVYLENKVRNAFGVHFSSF